ncbi:hypothetical protein HYR69_12345, partial [Candidatus Sumerlaeota bacterium]|nr:hypothetical protein [Candidatus Sumerlaeota bacterium]
MEDPSLHPPRHNARTAILIALLLSYAFLMSRDLRTIGKQGDSLAYYASAQSFSEKGVFLLPDGTPNIIWPPGYSLALSLYAIEGISIGAHARLLQILYYMLIAGGAWLALESACRSGATNTRSIFYW